MDLREILKIANNRLTNETVNGLLQPSAESIGKALKSILDVFTFPLNMAGIYTNGELEKYKKEIEEEIQRVPLEHRQLDKLNLACETIEKSQYRLSNQTLRKAFAHLIGSTLDDRINGVISPRFTSVLSDLSPEDAWLLKDIASHSNKTILNISGYVFQGEAHYIPNKILYLEQNYQAFYRPGNSIDILESLGILKESEIDMTLDTISDEAYLQIIKNINQQEKQNTIKIDLDHKIELLNRSMTLTEFGKSFIACVVSKRYLGSVNNEKH